MKRKLAWLALPLVLAALMLGVKWRVEHPIVTKEDLKVRALISSSSRAEFDYYRSTQIVGCIRYNPTYLSNSDLRLIAQQLYLLPQKAKSNSLISNKKGMISINFPSEFPLKEGAIPAYFILNLDDGTGAFFDKHQPKEKQPRRSVHPVTVRRWIELLKAHPRIGPELRARLK